MLVSRNYITQACAYLYAITVCIDIVGLCEFGENRSDNNLLMKYLVNCTSRELSIYGLH